MALLSITGTLAAGDASFGDAERPTRHDQGRRAQRHPRWNGAATRPHPAGQYSRAVGVGRARRPTARCRCWRSYAGETDEWRARPDDGWSRTAEQTGSRHGGLERQHVRHRLEVGTLVVQEGLVRFTRPDDDAAVRRRSVAAGLDTRASSAPRRRRGARSSSLRGSPEAPQVELQGTTGAIGGPIFADLQGKCPASALNRTNPYLNKLLGWVAREGSSAARPTSRSRMTSSWPRTRS
jgi:hypothetical protein